MVKMTLERAVSTADPRRKRYCLLRGDETEMYRCTEAAAKLGAKEKETRIPAYWLHFKTHIKPYTRWARNRRLFDPTAQYSDPLDGAAELVEDVLLSFYRKIEENQYNPDRGPPCRYIKRSIKNKYQDLLRRGRHPTAEECMRCWEERGSCPVSETERPWDQDRQRCFRPFVVEDFGAVSATFAAVGLHDQWPPTQLQDMQCTPATLRPVEEQALDRAMIAYIWELMPRVLTLAQRTVLVETFLHHRTSREIARMIQTTPGNVDQIRHRGLRRLYRALSL
jgi:RNA polymerase sigma factor (sigma-70 family)